MSIDCLQMNTNQSEPLCPPLVYLLVGKNQPVTFQGCTRIDTLGGHCSNTCSTKIEVGNEVISTYRTNVFMASKWIIPSAALEVDNGSVLTNKHVQQWKTRGFALVCIHMGAQIHCRLRVCALKIRILKCTSG